MSDRGGTQEKKTCWGLNPPIQDISRVLVLKAKVENETPAGM